MTCSTALVIIVTKSFDNYNDAHEPNVPFEMRDAAERAAFDSDLNLGPCVCDTGNRDPKDDAYIRELRFAVR